MQLIIQVFYIWMMMGDSMNGRKDILSAWITIEQLSEGSINKKDKALKPLHTVEDRKSVV